MSELTATLYINLFDSRCGHCGKPTLLCDRRGAPTTHHTRISGYGRGGPGCGARFVDTASDYRNITADKLRDLRPDLPVHAKPDTEETP